MSITFSPDCQNNLQTENQEEFKPENQDYITISSFTADFNDNVPTGSVLIDIESEKINNNMICYTRTWKPPKFITIVGANSFLPNCSWRASLYYLCKFAHIKSQAIQHISKLDKHTTVIYFPTQHEKIANKEKLLNYLEKNNLDKISVI